VESRMQDKKKQKVDPDGPLPKWGSPEGVKLYLDKTPGQKKVKEACWDGYKKVGMKKKGNKMVPNCVKTEQVKTIKVGEDAVGSDKCHYALVMDRKVQAIGTKEEMLAKCAEEGGRVWVSTKQVGDIVEAKYSVDVEGLPRFYMDADSPAQIKKSLRVLLRKASSIDSVERVNDAKIKQDLRQRIKGADTDKRNVDEKLDPTKHDAGDYIKDFRDSDAPQFKGKSDKKKRQMAIAAYLNARRQKGLEEMAYRKPTPAEIAADKKKDQKSGGDRYKSMKKKMYGNAMGGLKKESSAEYGKSMDRIQAKKTASQLSPEHKKKLAALHNLMKKQRKTGNYKMEEVEQMDESKKAVSALNMLAKKDSRVIPDQIAMLNKIVMDGKHKDAHKFVRVALDKKIAPTVAGILRKHGIKEEKDMTPEEKAKKRQAFLDRLRGKPPVKEAYEYLGEEDGYHYVKVHGVRAGDHIVVKTKAPNKRAAVASVKKQWPKDKVTYHDRHNEERDMNEGMVRAVATARRMAGNMTGASKKIDKMKPAKKSGPTGRFSDNPRIAKKLQKYNEDMQSWKQFVEGSCGGYGGKKMRKEGELSPAQKKHMDTDKDGDIDGKDLATLRNKKKS